MTDSQLLHAFTAGSQQAFAGLVASSITIPDPPVDFVQLTPDGSFHGYFQKTKPFYQRKKKILGLF